MRRGCRAATALAALLIVSAAAPIGGFPIALAADAGDLFTFDSSGDYLGKDGHEVLTDADSSIFIQAGGGLPGAVQVQAYRGSHEYRVTIGPGLGPALQVGDYPDATRFGDEDSAQIDIGFDSSGCNVSTGSFHIYSLSRDGAGAVVSIAFSYTFACEDDAGLLVGRVRVDDDTPMASLTLPRTSRDFEPIKAGLVTPTREYTIGSDGDVPVTIGSLSMSGSDASTLPIAADGCSGTTLAPGETCSYHVRFEPTSPCWCRAVLSIPSAGFPTLRLHYQGSGLIPTIVTLVPKPDLTHLTGGVVIAIRVSPVPRGGEYRCDVDGVLTMASPGSECFVPRVLGTHTATAYYLGGEDLAPGVSAPVDYTVADATSTTLTANPTIALYGQSTTLTARVGTSSDLLFAGGSVSIIDQDSGVVLASGPVDGASPSVSVAVRFTEGVHHVIARYDHGTGPHLDSAAGPSDIVVRSAMTPAANLVSGVRFAPSSMALTIHWASTDLAHVDRFTLQGRIAGGAWASIPLATPLTRAARVVVRAGSTYEYRVRATDPQGHVSAWATSDPIRPTYYQETTTRASWTSGWHTSSSTSALGGTTRYSSTKGRSVTFTFTGRSVGLVSPLSSSRGSADIYVDGAYAWTASLTQARSESRRVVFVRSWSASGLHTVKVVVNGHQHPRIDIDAFEIIR